MIEKGYKKELEELAQLASENQTSIEVEIINGDNDILKEFVEECRKKKLILWFLSMQDLSQKINLIILKKY